MSYGQTELQTLLEDSSITSLLADASFIFFDSVVPDELVGPKDATINYYRISPVDGGLDYMQTSYSVNCRAYTMSEAEAISRAVFEVLNRHYSDSVFFVVSVLTTLPPFDTTDNYNSPVEVIAKGRNI